MQIALGLLKLVKIFPDWFLGALGTVTSSISLATIWVKTK